MLHVCEQFGSLLLLLLADFPPQVLHARLVRAVQVLLLRFELLVHFREEAYLDLQLLLQLFDVVDGALPLRVQSVHLLRVLFFEALFDALVLQLGVSLQLLLELAQHRVDLGLPHLHHLLF